ncbi:uncharacterized protein LOC131981379 [Centropristis striata]|uniref:uncharacterized protein LOC131981379 n=1 Tax=Centropristis striata TaxID=184440 RepID=UPI0027DF4C0C|nr:uncharacterized protein LOC131981379 [Centropristis striata]
MILLCVALLVLHQGDALVPVITVKLGEPVTFTCVLPDAAISRRDVHWYKQSAGETLKSLVTMQKNVQHVYGPEYSASRLDLIVNKTHSNLTILSTIQEDEGMYHCALVDWINITWSGSYLSLKGKTQRTSDYTVVQLSESNPVRPEDPITLQCSVLSDSERNTCHGGHSVFWFKSVESHPNIIYTDGESSHECEKKSDSQKSCVYCFSKNVTSSDAGTYYCAVATCGEILFGNITKLHIESDFALKLVLSPMSTT